MENQRFMNGGCESSASHCGPSSEHRCRDPKWVLAYAFGIAVFIPLVLGYAAALLSDLVGTVYPISKSIKAIRSPTKNDDTEWLMYWVVFALFSIVEFFADALLFWFPFYYLTKCIFLLWCMLPVSWNGSSVIYNKVIDPFVGRHENRLEQMANEAAQGTANLVRSGEDNLVLAQRGSSSEMQESLSIVTKPSDQEHMVPISEVPEKAVAAEYSNKSRDSNQEMRSGTNSRNSVTARRSVASADEGEKSKPTLVKAPGSPRGSNPALPKSNPALPGSNPALPGSNPALPGSNPALPGSKPGSQAAVAGIEEDKKTQ